MTGRERGKMNFKKKRKERGKMTAKESVTRCHRPMSERVAALLPVPAVAISVSFPVPFSVSSLLVFHSRRRRLGERRR